VNFLFATNASRKQNFNFLNMDIYAEIAGIKKVQEETLAMLKDLHNRGAVGNKDKVYDLTDLEGLLHISRRTLFKHLSSGILGHSKIGKKIYVSDKELQQFLVSNKQVN